MGVAAKDLTVEDFYFLKVRNMWRYFKKEHFSFWMICAYLFVEYARPQSIYPAIDVLPWAQIFLLGSIAGAVLDPTVRWVSSPINKILNLFAFVILISSFLAYRPDISSAHYLTFYGWFVIYYAIILIVNTRERFYIFLMVFLICAGKISLGTTLNWASRGFSFAGWGLTGPPGFFQNSGELAILMLTLFPVALYLFEQLKPCMTKIEQVVLLVFIVTPVLTTIGASSRGGQLAMLVQFALIFRNSIFRVKRLVVLVLFLALAYHFMPEEQIARFESAGDDRTSLQRLMYWKRGIEMIEDHPLLGVGYFNFPIYFYDHFSADLIGRKNAQLPHNIFIQVGTDAGLMGLSLFLLLCFLPFFMVRSSFRRYSYDSVTKAAINGFLMGNLGYVVAGQFVSVAYYPFLWIGLAFIVAGLNSGKRIRAGKTQGDLTVARFASTTALTTPD